jgi:hypothetical protein
MEMLYRLSYIGFLYYKPNNLMVLPKQLYWLSLLIFKALRNDTLLWAFFQTKAPALFSAGASSIIFSYTLSGAINTTR